jgi:putative metallohydrolase (TIGR04338 family)
MTDRETAATYAADDMVSAWLDAVSVDDGTVQVRLTRGGGARRVTFTPEPEPRFTRPAEVQRFVDAVLERLRAQTRQFGSAYRGREAKEVRVVAHAGSRRASYRDGTIRLPQRERGGAWALRGLVVAHELAHHLNTGDGAIIDEHGAGFRATFVRLLEDLGWAETAAMLRAAFVEVGADRPEGVDDGMVAKIGKLLRHAEGASTEAERDAFLAKAQELATTHSVELTLARAAATDGESVARPTFESVRLGHPRQRSNVRYVSLMVAVAQANDVRLTIRGDNTGVTLYGFAADIAVTKTLYASLVVQMVTDGDAYIRSGAHKPVHGSTARAAFYAGWTDRIGDRLREAQARAQLSAGAATEQVDPRTGQVSVAKVPALVAKDVEVEDYYGSMLRQHGVRGTWRGGAQVRDGRSVLRGMSAADRARLGRSGEISA